jgi:hypothetical protein
MNEQGVPLIRTAEPGDRLELRSMQALSVRVLGAGYYTDNTSLTRTAE